MSNPQWNEHPPAGEGGHGYPARGQHTPSPGTPPTAEHPYPSAPDNPFPPKSGGIGGWWKGLAAGSGLVLLLCCGGAVVLGLNGDEDGDKVASTSSDESSSRPRESSPASKSTATKKATSTAAPKKTATATKTVTETAPAQPAAPPVEEETEEPPQPEETAESDQGGLTAGQSNAIESAESYLDFMAFSRQGLIDQLSSEYGDSYSVADATYAVDHIEVDWNEQAAKSAESYLESSSFSRQGLIDQLSSEYGDQFTQEQAEYGATAAGL